MPQSNDHSRSCMVATFTAAAHGVRRGCAQKKCLTASQKMRLSSSKESVYVSRVRIST
jgi:hypothetical protein